MKKKTLNPFVTAIGTTFVVTLAASPIAQAGDNPFGMNELSNGYMVADAEGKCGENKDESEGKCGNKDEMKDESGTKDEGEGKCGGKTESEGKCGS